MVGPLRGEGVKSPEPLRKKNAITSRNKRKINKQKNLLVMFCDGEYQSTEKLYEYFLQSI